MSVTNTQIDIKDLVRLLDQVVEYKQLATELKVALEELLENAPGSRNAAIEAVEDAVLLLKGE